MADFFSENNICGQTILRLVSRGNAIIAELLRLSDFIPSIFKSTINEPNQYTELLFDFGYFKNAELYENKILSRQALEELDEELKESCMDIINRFYQAFESIHQYVIDLNRFLSDVDDGIFIQQTLESLFNVDEAKQLMIEALFLYGVMLLVLDQNFDGLIRERILVSYYRYSAAKQSLDSSIDEVCKLLRSTGFTSNLKQKPFNYPENYFTRITINPIYISLVISRLRSEDIYNQIHAYPHADQRSTALSTQAGMLYICLYFDSNVLKLQHAAMREVVDRHFPDNWVVSLYMGITVNLIDEWTNYKAAFGALANTIDVNTVRNQAQKHGEKYGKLMTLLGKLSKAGVLTETYVQENVNKLLATLRECNVTLRWLLLHTSAIGVENNKKCRQLRDQVVQDSGCALPKIFALLLITSEFELNLKEILKRILDNKRDNWTLQQVDATSRVNELSEVFHGTQPLTRVNKDENLQNWFSAIGRQISSLGFDDSNVTGRKIVQIIRALEEVQEFHQLESQVQIRQFLLDTRSCLHLMLRLANIREEILITVDIIGDLSYAWIVIKNFTSLMQENIRKDPSLVTKLRATFLKLSSALDLPLLRINQANSSDMLSVSQYYSNELVTYVRQVLQIIPESMFSFLSRIIELQTNKIIEMPTRLDKDKLKDFAQLDDRYEVAKLTHSISTFTEGILLMKTTLVGIIKIDPRQLLEDGVRKELVKRVSFALHNTLIFNHKNKNNDLLSCLDGLSQQMDGYRRSFEYIQDYVNIYGLQIWQEELQRVINFNVEQECNIFLKNKIHPWQSAFQSRVIPICLHPPLDNESTTFIGRLVREILKKTDPKITSYIDSSNTWYDSKTKVEIIDYRMFDKLELSVGTWGMSGIDKMLSFLIVRELEQLQTALIKFVDADKTLHQALNKLSSEINVFEPVKSMGAAAAKFNKFSGMYLQATMKIGQMQLLRRQIGRRLSSQCQFDSKFLFAALDNFNTSLLTDLWDLKNSLTDQKDSLGNAKNSSVKDNKELFYQLSLYLDCVGLDDPQQKIYLKMKSIPNLSFINFVLVYSNLNQKFLFNKTLGELLARKTTDRADGTPFVVGVATFLNQFNASNLVSFFVTIGKYLRLANVNQNSIIENVQLIGFVEQMIRCSHFDKQILENQIPTDILDTIKSLSSAT